MPKPKPGGDEGDQNKGKQTTTGNQTAGDAGAHLGNQANGQGNAGGSGEQTEDKKSNI